MTHQASYVMRVAIARRRHNESVSIMSADIVASTRVHSPLSQVSAILNYRNGEDPCAVIMIESQERVANAARSIANSDSTSEVHRLCALVTVRFGGEIIVRGATDSKSKLQPYTRKTSRTNSQTVCSAFSRTFAQSDCSARVGRKEQSMLRLSEKYRAAFTTRVIIQRGKALRDICMRIFCRFENVRST